MAHTAGNTSNLTRANIWGNEIKEVLKDELAGQGYVRFLTDFPDGTTFNIPSIGESTINNYVEDTPVVYNPLDTGNFTFVITDYVSSGTYITEQARQDLFYSSELEASFVPKQSRALAERLETDTLALAAGGASGGQTVSVPNQVNGADHRFVATGTDQGTDDHEIALKDFAKARFALKKANVPDAGLVAIVDPSVEYTINTLTNLTNVSNNMAFEGIITSGIASGPRFVKNVYGFDVYVSNYLADAGTVGAETITGGAGGAIAAGKCNIFMSAAEARLLPFMGAWRQMPKVDGEYNKDFQREEYVTTARWGLKVYRPENLVVCLSSTEVIV
jgi:hypothetical protein